MKKLVLLILAVFILHGCGTQPKSTPSQALPNISTEPYQPYAPPVSQSQGIDDNTSLKGTPITQAIPTERIIYFDFDQSEIRFNDRLVLEQHAAYLASNPQASVRLEGHADERGSREYNLALGERRALAAKRVLNILGIDNYRVSTLSYGEEMPLEYGHSEVSWQRNRRVEIVYP
ncbi:peptidoglycan-associated lipoprotein Pal [Candidatus Albibeggiatoa sp. nov. NOAA]|uniref:peptidoglycan-associated lipoprotein Pal n=1 Tax=Candidatus Albibeggiatoa sp. nov. NOAA TaxID=3162724 RepID=UPI0032F951BF|nr:peptidoglycan-associated lipoprotein Pal [Thiotrichaceae bacterium]